MIVPVLPRAREVQDDLSVQQRLRKRRRRGVTSIEYVFMVSLILLACIIGVQQVGLATKAFFTTSADKTKIMDPAQQNSSQ